MTNGQYALIEDFSKGKWINKLEGRGIIHEIEITVQTEQIIISHKKNNKLLVETTIDSQGTWVERIYLLKQGYFIKYADDTCLIFGRLDEQSMQVQWEDEFKRVSFK